jgi:hypothetical protein
MRDIDAAEDWLDSWAASANERARAAAELARQVSRLTGTARSSDGSIRVTVGSTGQVEDLHLTDPIGPVTGADLSRRIVRVIRAAQAKLSEEVAATVEQIVGADTETGRAVIGSFTTRFPEPPTDPRTDPS